MMNLDAHHIVASRLITVRDKVIAHQDRFREMVQRDLRMTLAELITGLHVAKVKISEDPAGRGDLWQMDIFVFSPEDLAIFVDAIREDAARYRPAVQAFTDIQKEKVEP